MSSYQLLNITTPGKATPWNISVDRGNHSLNVIIDTRVSKSLKFTLKVATFEELWPERNLSCSQGSLFSPSGENIPLLESVDVIVSYIQNYRCHKVATVAKVPVLH